MNKLKPVIIAGAALAALAASCAEPANTNNANRAASNTAVVTNSNGNTSVVSTTNANTANTNAARAHPRDYTREEYSRDKERIDREIRDEAERVGRKIGQGANDAWLWLKTRYALAAAEDLRDSTIDVDVENDVVTLSGTVASNAQKSAAEKAARTVEGVKRVQNNLRISAERGTNANRNANSSK
jgi:osmotically-inducible protein OsmY